MLFRSLGEVQAGENKTFAVTRTGRTPLDKWVQRYGASFSTAASQRKQSFGGNQNYLPDVANCSMAASFVSQLGTRPKANDWEPPSGGFVTTSGQDLTLFMARGDAIVMAWAADYAPVKPMNRFTPRRSHRDTLFRVATPVK